MKSTAALFQICALYLLLGGCNPATIAPPNVTGEEHDEFSLNSTEINKAQTTTVKPYYAAYYNNIMTVGEKIGENVSDTPPPAIDNMIDDDEEPTNNHGSLNRSKQKDYSKYEQKFKSLLEYLASASRKYKAKMMMTTEQSLGKELTTNTFNDLVATEMPQTKHPSTAANETAELLNSSTQSAALAVTSHANSKATPYYPTPTSYTTNTTTERPTYTTPGTITTSTWSPTTPCPTPTGTTVTPSTTTTTARPPPPTTPYYPTTKRPKSNRFSCTLCVIMVVNE